MKFIILKDKTSIKITDDQYKEILKAKNDDQNSFVINEEYIPFSSVFRITDEKTYFKYYESRYI